MSAQLLVVCDFITSLEAAFRSRVERTIVFHSKEPRDLRLRNLRTERVTKLSRVLNEVLFSDCVEQSYS